MAPRNWGRWGSDDERGAANLITADIVRNSVQLVSEGRVVPLGLPLRDRTTPVFGQRPSILHGMAVAAGDYTASGVPDDAAKSADDYLLIPLHAGTHLDALAHAWYGGKLYNGYPESEIRGSGARRLGIEKAPPLVTRGVLIDLVAHCDREVSEQTAFTRADIEAALAAEDVQLRPGDLPLVRTGWLEAWRGAGRPPVTYSTQQRGLAHDTLPFWLDADVVAVGADNCTVEVWPSKPGTDMPLHTGLLRDGGVYLLELLDLEQLSETGRYEFLVVVAPLLITGGTASPVNPLAIL